MPDARDPAESYQVLARKYRPAHFRDLIGQEPMVRVLRNAFAHDRIAHAFILTGVRGVGKTTTARIIAKGLNCLREGRPSIEPCGQCDACVSIAAGRNTDVIEMDAASNTGVDNMREVIDSVRYRASAARFKVYIIDEVHMLSTSAFNALLKTLEEPPAHVKFIFATTEIRKVPVTVLSRCQRFDLRRIEPEMMRDHLRGIADAEGAVLGEDALALIIRAAEGSVRDALSLLDQAIALGFDGAIDAAGVRAMLGLADRGRVMDLFSAIMAGQAPQALAELGSQYADGMDPGAILRDLAELTHWISVLKISPDAAADPTINSDELARGKDLAGRLSMRVLSRAWQMLLKAMDELALAPNAMMAAEMAVIRLCYVADLPPPEELVRKLQSGEKSGEKSGEIGQNGPPGSGTGSGTDSGTDSGAGSANPRPAPKQGPDGCAPPSAAIGHDANSRGANSRGANSRGQAFAAVPDKPGPVAQDPVSGALAAYPHFTDVLTAIKAVDFKLFDECEHYIRLVKYRPGMIEFNPQDGAPGDLAGRLGTALQSISGQRWSVLVSDQPGAPTCAETRRENEDEALRRAKDHPLVKAALAAFPQARIHGVRPLENTKSEPKTDDYLAPAPEADDIEGDLLDTDDPFEEE